MISSTYINLIDSLTEKTNSGNSLWNKTAIKNQYKLILNNGMIVLTYNNNIKGMYMELEIYNNVGQKIDSVHASMDNNPTDYTYLYNLYQKIYEIKEIKTNEQINKFISEIRSSDKIGKEE